MASRETAELDIIVTTNVQEQIKRDSEAIDQLTRRWKAQEAEIIMGVRQAGQVINQTIQGFRIALHAMNMTLGPLESAMLSMITTGVSVAISVAEMLISGIITAPAGLILAAAAFGVQIGSTAALMKSMGETRSMMAFLEQRINRLPTDIVSGLGGF